MMSSIKKNFIYSSFLTLSNYIFPLLTYPYVSRVLGVSNIGICNYVDGIIHYFIMFSTLGLSVVGIREIAAVGDNKNNRSRVFSSLFTLHAITTIIGAIVLLICIWTVPEFKANSRMMYIGLLKLLFNLTLIEWFYKGIENFKYITNRTLVVRTIYVLSVFLFIRDEDDYDMYYLLTNLSIAINSIINIIYSKNYVSFNFKSVSLRPYLGGFSTIGIYNLVSSLYTSFNVVYLGMVTDNVQVGYYATAQKLYMIIIALYTAFTSVMMPRMSSLLSDGKYDEFKEYINKSTTILFSFSIPLIIVTGIFSSDIINILSGPGYEGSIVPMQLVMPLILIIGYEQILVVQTLMPLKKDRLIFINSAIGAVVGLLLNFLLVPIYGAIGSSIVWLFCELVVLISAQCCVSHITRIHFPTKKLIRNVIVYIPAIVICLLISTYWNAHYIRLLFVTVFISLYFFLIQRYLIKDPVILNIYISCKATISKTINKTTK